MHLSHVLCPRTVNESVCLCLCRESRLARLLGTPHEVSRLQGPRRAPEGEKQSGEHIKIIVFTSSESTRFLFSSWTTSLGLSRSAGRTGCGGTCPRCRLATGSRSSASSLEPSSSLRTSSCSAKPGRTAAPDKSGSSNLWVRLVLQFTSCGGGVVLIFIG